MAEIYLEEINFIPEILNIVWRSINFDFWNTWKLNSKRPWFPSWNLETLFYSREAQRNLSWKTGGFWGPRMNWRKFLIYEHKQIEKINWGNDKIIYKNSNG